MSRTQFSLVLVVTLIGSLIGGVLGGRWMAPSPADAQKANSVRAEEFLLLDQSGNARAGLGLDQNGEVGLVLKSRDGNRTLALSPDERTIIKLTERGGRLLWAVP